jgi:hypothetical protein
VKEVKNKGKNAYKALVNKLMKQTEGRNLKRKRGSTLSRFLLMCMRGLRRTVWLKDRNNRSSTKPIGKTLVNLPALARDP